MVSVCSFSVLFFFCIWNFLHETVLHKLDLNSKRHEMCVTNLKHWDNQTPNLVWLWLVVIFLNEFALIFESLRKRKKKFLKKCSILTKPWILLGSMFVYIEPTNKHPWSSPPKVKPWTWKFNVSIVFMYS